MHDLIYILMLIPFLAAGYFILFYFWPWLLDAPRPALGRGWRRSLFVIVFSFLCVMLLVQLIPSIFWGNRVQHALGGGLIVFLISYRAVKDGIGRVDPLKFFVITFLAVISVGVANELLESLLQFFFGFISSANPTDTWLDLWSNTVGAFLGGTVLTPLISKKR